MSRIQGKQMWPYHRFQMDQIFIYLFCFSSLENPCEWIHHCHPEKNRVPVFIWSERRNILKGKGPTETVPRKATHTPLPLRLDTQWSVISVNIRWRILFCTFCMDLPLSPQWSLTIPRWSPTIPCRRSHHRRMWTQLLFTSTSPFHILNYDLSVIKCCRHFFHRNPSFAPNSSFIYKSHSLVQD